MKKTPAPKDNAGWYPDPEFPGKKRYWTGTQWDASDPRALASQTFDLLPLLLDAQPYEPYQPPKQQESPFSQWRRNAVPPLADTMYRRMRIFFYVAVLISTLFLVFTIGNKKMMDSTGEGSAQSISTPEISLAPGLYSMAPDTSTRTGDFCTFTGQPEFSATGTAGLKPPAGLITIFGRGDGQCGIGSSTTITRVLFSVYNGEAFIELVQ